MREGRAPAATGWAWGSWEGLAEGARSHCAVHAQHRLTLQTTTLATHMFGIGRTVGYAPHVTQRIRMYAYAYACRYPGMWEGTFSTPENRVITIVTMRAGVP